jgi:predicted sugar kinase
MEIKSGQKPVTDLKGDSGKVIGSSGINLKISHLKINISQYSS